MNSLTKQRAFVKMKTGGSVKKTIINHRDCEDDGCMGISDVSLKVIRCLMKRWKTNDYVDWVVYSYSMWMICVPPRTDDRGCVYHVWFDSVNKIRVAQNCIT